MNDLNLLRKAKDDIDLATKLVSDERQHDNVGYHLAQAVEKILKYMLEQRRIGYLKSSRGHNLRILLGQLKTSSQHFDKYERLLDLDVYQSNIRYDYLPQNERADLKLMLEGIYELLREVETLGET